MSGFIAAYWDEQSDEIEVEEYSNKLAAVKNEIKLYADLKFVPTSTTEESDWVITTFENDMGFMAFMVIAPDADRTNAIIRLQQMTMEFEGK